MGTMYAEPYVLAFKISGVLKMPWTKKLTSNGRKDVRQLCW